MRPSDKRVCYRSAILHISRMLHSGGKLFPHFESLCQTPISSVFKCLTYLNQQSNVLYSSVTDEIPVPTDIPSGFGPFNVDGYVECEYDGGVGLTCNPDAVCTQCVEGTECYNESETCGVAGIPIDGAGYITEIICMW